MTRDHSHLLIPEPPLQVLPSLATAIGLNEAIFIQQLHYRLINSRHEHDGRRWVFNTTEEWQEQFPFWSTRTIKRLVSRLRDMGLIITTDAYNKTRADRTLWYTIDYERLGTMVPNQRAECQVGTPRVTSWHFQSAKLAPSMRVPSWHSHTNRKEYIQEITTQEGGGGGGEAGMDNAHSGIGAEKAEAVESQRGSLQQQQNTTRAACFAFYESEIGPLSPFIAEQIDEYIVKCGADWVKDAIRIAAANNVRHWRYAAAILERWRREGRKDETSRPSARAGPQEDDPLLYRILHSAK